VIVKARIVKLVMTNELNSLFGSVRYLLASARELLDKNILAIIRISVIHKLNLTDA
jgi:hypothetical protein